ncbi:hypothetical protein ACFQV4_18855 [Streptomyces thermocarboxydus]
MTTALARRRASPCARMRPAPAPVKLDPVRRHAHDTQGARVRRT